jgi:hypothetical protein
MAMQYDVNSAYADAGGSIIGYPTRLKAVYIYAGASAGSLELTDGSGGTSLFKVATPASATSNPIYLILPGEGIRFSSSIFAVFSNIGAVTLIYG